MQTTPFKGLILRAVLRDVYPMVIRLVAVPDSLDLSDFDDIFHAVIGWDGGIGYAFQIQGQEFNSFQRKTRSKKLCDFRIHRQEKFLDPRPCAALSGHRPAKDHSQLHMSAHE